MEEKNPLELLLQQETPEEHQQNFEPKTFDDYLGQEELKKKLAIYTQAATMRNEPLDHMLLFGPPGLGKTTLSQIMAHVMDAGIKICTGPTLDRTGDLVAILTSLEARDILFIDEIHRMPTAVEEVLYSAMEHYRVDVIIGQGAGAKSINLPINPFTLVGATTMIGKLSAPLRSRFGIIERLDFYETEDLAQIVKQNAQYLKLKLSDDAADLIAQSSRGTPRTAKKLVRRVRDVAQVHHKNNADLTVTQEALGFLGINEQGLSKIDLLILEKITIDFNGGPVGLETLAAIIGEDKETLELVYEPYLMRQGYLEKTARGRQIPHNKLPYLKSKFFGQKTLV
jgi:Holliday junction DNA helicase RuvB